MYVSEEKQRGTANDRKGYVIVGMDWSEPVRTIDSSVGKRRKKRNERNVGFSVGGQRKERRRRKRGGEK